MNTKASTNNYFTFNQESISQIKRFVDFQITSHYNHFLCLVFLCTSFARFIVVHLAVAQFAWSMYVCVLPGDNFGDIKRMARRSLIYASPELMGSRKWKSFFLVRVFYFNCMQQSWHICCRSMLIWMLHTFDWFYI